MFYTTRVIYSTIICQLKMNLWLRKSNKAETLENININIMVIIQQ